MFVSRDYNYRHSAAVALSSLYALIDLRVGNCFSLCWFAFFFPSAPLLGPRGASWEWTAGISRPIGRSPGKLVLIPCLSGAEGDDAAATGD